MSTDKKDERNIFLSKEPSEKFFFVTCVIFTSKCFDKSRLFCIFLLIFGASAQLSGSTLTIENSSGLQLYQEPLGYKRSQNVTILKVSYKSLCSLALTFLIGISLPANPVNCD